jgi:hypothetical protein
MLAWPEAHHAGAARCGCGNTSVEPAAPRQLLRPPSPHTPARRSTGARSDAGLPDRGRGRAGGRGSGTGRRGARRQGRRGARRQGRRGARRQGRRGARRQGRRGARRQAAQAARPGSPPASGTPSRPARRGGRLRGAAHCDTAAAAQRPARPGARGHAGATTPQDLPSPGPGGGDRDRRGGSRVPPHAREPTPRPGRRHRGDRRRGLGDGGGGAAARRARGHTLRPDDHLALRPDLARDRTRGEADPTGVRGPAGGTVERAAARAGGAGRAAAVPPPAQLLLARTGADPGRGDRWRAGPGAARGTALRPGAVAVRPGAAPPFDGTAGGRQAGRVAAAGAHTAAAGHTPSGRTPAAGTGALVAAARRQLAGGSSWPRTSYSTRPPAAAFPVLRWPQAGSGPAPAVGDAPSSTQPGRGLGARRAGDPDR